MKNYFLAFVLAVLVVLTGLTLRRSFAAASTPSQAGTKLVAIGTGPVPLPPNAVPASPQAR